MAAAGADVLVRGLLLLTVLAALALAACGGGGGSAAPTTTSSAQTVSGSDLSSLIALAGQKTRAAGSARVSFKLEMTGGQANGTMSGEGVFDQHGGRMTMDLGGLAGGALGSGEAEVIFKELVYYMKLPAAAIAQLPPGKKWLKFDLGALSEQQGLDLEQLTQLNQSDPSQALRLLSGAEDFEEVGNEDVRGVETTRYRGTVDMNQVAENAPPDLQDDIRRIIEQTGDQTVPMDIWIDQDGLARRLQWTQHLQQGTTMTMDEELYDFGAEVDATTPPADEVLDLTALLGNS
jgi:LppX_LprAFG lipoprotein